MQFTHHTYVLVLLFVSVILGATYPSIMLRFLEDQLISDTWTEYTVCEHAATVVIQQDISQQKDRFCGLAHLWSANSSVCLKLPVLPTPFPNIVSLQLILIIVNYFESQSWQKSRIGFYLPTENIAQYGGPLYYEQS